MTEELFRVGDITKTVWDDILTDEQNLMNVEIEIEILHKLTNTVPLGGFKYLDQG